MSHLYISLLVSLTCTAVHCQMPHGHLGWDFFTNCKLGGHFYLGWQELGTMSFSITCDQKYGDGYYDRNPMMDLEGIISRFHQNDGLMFRRQTMAFRCVHTVKVVFEVHVCLTKLTCCMLTIEDQIKAFLRTKQSHLCISFIYNSHRFPLQVQDLWLSSFLFIILIIDYLYIRRELTKFLLSKPTICIQLGSRHVHYVYDIMTFCVDVDHVTNSTGLEINTNVQKTLSPAYYLWG